jgi:hypothetical protein
MNWLRFLLEKLCLRRCWELSDPPLWLRLLFGDEIQTAYRAELAMAHKRRRVAYASSRLTVDLIEIRAGDRQARIRVL